MRKSDLFALYFCTILTMSIMYASQPLQPYFEEFLNVSKFKASMFTTAILAPLAIASIFYGFILEKISIKKALISVFGAFGILEIVFASSSRYEILLIIRILQGLIVPIALTGIVSFISLNSPKNRVASAVAAYIGVTIAGGFLGRFLCGISFDFFGWRAFFYILAILLFLAAFLIAKIDGNATTNYAKPRLKTIFYIFVIKHNRYVYLAIFGIYFVFQAVLNILPFELLRLSGDFSGAKTGAIYFGYIIGILVSFNAAKIVKFFKNEPRAIMFGAVVFLLSLQMLMIEIYSMIFISMLVFCLGSFIAHAVANGYVNKKNLSHKAISNGLYISFYYTGGAIGSFVPGFFYGKYGWSGFLSVLTAVVILSIFCILKLNKVRR